MKSKIPLFQICNSVVFVLYSLHKVEEERYPRGENTVVNGQEAEMEGTTTTTDVSMRAATEETIVDTLEMIAEIAVTIVDHQDVMNMVEVIAVDTVAVEATADHHALEITVGIVEAVVVTSRIIVVETVETIGIEVGITVRSTMTDPNADVTTIPCIDPEVGKGDVVRHP